MSDNMKDEVKKLAAPIVVIQHETLAESIISDLTTLVIGLLFIGIGVWVDSTALEWVGAIMFFLTLVTQVTARSKRVSIGEARARLDEIEAQRGITPTPVDHDAIALSTIRREKANFYATHAGDLCEALMEMGLVEKWTSDEEVDFLTTEEQIALNAVRAMEAGYQPEQGTIQ